MSIHLLSTVGLHCVVILIILIIIIIIIIVIIIFIYLLPSYSSIIHGTGDRIRT